MSIDDALNHSNKTSQINQDAMTKIENKTIQTHLPMRKEMRKRPQAVVKTHTNCVLMS